MGVLSYHVNGPCYIQTGTGASNAYETLGLTVDGCRIRITYEKEPIHSDAAGPRVPAELQAMGSTATIECELMTWNETVMTDVLTRAAATGVLGQAGFPGALVGTNSWSFAVEIPTVGDLAWNFPTCTLMNPDNLNVGTRAGKKAITFFAWQFVAGNLLTAAGIPLYTRT